MGGNDGSECRESPNITRGGRREEKSYIWNLFKVNSERKIGRVRGCLPALPAAALLLERKTKPVEHSRGMYICIHIIRAAELSRANSSFEPRLYNSLITLAHFHEALSRWRHLLSSLAPCLSTCTYSQSALEGPYTNRALCADSLAPERTQLHNTLFFPPRACGPQPRFSIIATVCSSPPRPTSMAYSNFTFVSLRIKVKHLAFEGVKLPFNHLVIEK